MGSEKKISRLSRQLEIDMVPSEVPAPFDDILSAEGQATRRKRRGAAAEACNPTSSAAVAAARDSDRQTAMKAQAELLVDSKPVQRSSGRDGVRSNGVLHAKCAEAMWSPRKGLDVEVRFIDREWYKGTVDEPGDGAGSWRVIFKDGEEWEIKMPGEGVCLEGCAHTCCHGGRPRAAKGFQMFHGRHSKQRGRPNAESPACSTKSPKAAIPRKNRAKGSSMTRGSMHTPNAGVAPRAGSTPLTVPRSFVARARAEVRGGWREGQWANQEGWGGQCMTGDVHDASNRAGEAPWCGTLLLSMAQPMTGFCSADSLPLPSPASAVAAMATEGHAELLVSGVLRTGAAGTERATANLFGSLSATGGRGEFKPLSTKRKHEAATSFSECWAPERFKLRRNLACALAVAGPRGGALRCLGSPDNVVALATSACEELAAAKMGGSGSRMSRSVSLWLPASLQLSALLEALETHRDEALRREVSSIAVAPFAELLRACQEPARCVKRLVRALIDALATASDERPAEIPILQRLIAQLSDDLSTGLPALDPLHVLVSAYSAAPNPLRYRLLAVHAGLNPRHVARLGDAVLASTFSRSPLPAGCVTSWSDPPCWRKFAEAYPTLGAAPAEEAHLEVYLPHAPGEETFFRSSEVMVLVAVAQALAATSADLNNIWVAKSASRLSRSTSILMKKGDDIHAASTASYLRFLLPRLQGFRHPPAIPSESPKACYFFS